MNLTAKAQKEWDKIQREMAVADRKGDHRAWRLAWAKAYGLMVSCGAEAGADEAVIMLAISHGLVSKDAELTMRASLAAKKFEAGLDG